MSDVIFPDGTLLGDVVANLNVFSSNPATSRGKGEIIYNSTDDEVYKNTGTSGSPVWVGIGGGASATGTNNTTFTLDEDNVGAGVNTALKFNRGSSGDDARLLWSETYGKFYLDDGTNKKPLSVSDIETEDGISFDGATKNYTMKENDVTGDLEVTMPTGKYFVIKTV
jgi:hypothetical protein